jgi:uncharacterized protein (TIGR02246 family)
MTTESTKTNDEARIRSTVDEWASAIRAKDVNGVLCHFASDSVIFDLAPPLQAQLPFKENLEGWFATFRGSVGYEIRNLHITTADGLAYSHSFNRLTGTKNDGENPDVWFRMTLCFRRVDGQWLITHAHESVPFYMDGSYKAAVDLKL